MLAARAKQFIQDRQQRTAETGMRRFPAWAVALIVALAATVISGLILAYVEQWLRLGR